MPLEAVQLIIRGRVQGVGFRYATLSQAQSLGLYGWVRNMPDGSVETYAEGKSDQIAQFVQWCHQGPTHAQVSAVEELKKETCAQITHEKFLILR